MLLEPKHVRHFILGGKSEFILTSKKTGNSFRYKVIKKENKDLYFVYVYIIDKYKYAGSFTTKNDKCAYKQGEKGWYHETTTEIQALLYVLKKGKNLPPQCEVEHLGRCARCGRTLKDAESIERGFGSECYKKIL